LLLISGLVSAQEVTFSPGGVASITGVPIIYNGQYVIQKSDFGFFWLDTVALQAGLVEVEAKCGVGMPAAQTNIYVIGDCNGITSVSSSGNVVLARQFNGQCAAAKLSCNGDRTGGVGMFKFGLGSWDYQGPTDTDIPDSTQTADLAGPARRLLADNLTSFTVIPRGTPPTPPHP